MRIKMTEAKTPRPFPLSCEIIFTSEVFPSLARPFSFCNIVFDEWRDKFFDSLIQLFEIRFVFYISQGIICEKNREIFHTSFLCDFHHGGGIKFCAFR